MLQNFIQAQVTTFSNKLERLLLANLSSRVKCLWVRPVAYPRVEDLKGASLGLAPASNIRLGWKGLSGTNALAYYEKS
jgi:hypothetical protein